MSRATGAGLYFDERIACQVGVQELLLDGHFALAAWAGKAMELASQDFVTGMWHAANVDAFGQERRKRSFAGTLN